MANPIATAFVEVVPDTRAFAGLLQAKVTAAIRAVKVPPVLVPVGVAGGGATLGALAAESELLAGAQLHVGETAVTTTAAERALDAQLRKGGVDMSIFAAETRAAALAEAQLAEGALVANVGLGNTSKASRRAAEGMVAAKTEANLLRGAFIGLARVTPVAVFGLGIAGTAAIAFGLGLKKSVELAAQFEQSLNVFQAVSGATAEQMKEVSKAAIDLGADLTLPATSAQDAADALTALVKAGLSIPDALAGVKGALQLGTAGDLTPRDAAEAIASVINSFELGGDAATHVADVFASTASAAQGDISDFVIALSQASAVAHQSGLSFEQLSGIFVELARSGLKGADMGTSVRTTLLRLIPTTKEAAAFSDALGIKLDRSKTIGEQLPNVIDQYKSALDKLLPTQRTMVENQIVGQDAIRGFDIIVRKGSQGLAESQAAADKAGEANRQAAAKTKGLTGSFAALQNQAGKTGTALGQHLAPPLKIVVDLMTEGIKAGDGLFGAINKLTDNPEGKEKGFLAFGPTKGETEAFIGGKLSDAKSSFGRFWNNFTGEALKAEKSANAKIVAAHKAGAGTQSAGFGAFGISVLNSISPLGSRDPTFSREATAAEKRIRERVDAVTKVAAAIKKGVSDSRVRLGGAIDVARAEGNFTVLVAAQQALIRRDTVELRRLERVLRVGLGDVKAIGAQIKALKIEMANTLADIFAVFTDPRFNPTFANIELQGTAAAATETLVDDINNDKLAIAAAQQALSLALLGGASEGTLFDLRQKVETAQAKLVTDQRAATDAAKTAATSAATATKDAADAAQHALDVQEENLRFFADSADNQGKAEKKLLAFLLKRMNDAKGNLEAFNKARADYRSELEKFNQAAQEAISSSLDLQGARLDTRLAAALLTKPIDDEKRIYNDQIKLLNIRIANQEKVAQKAGVATAKGRAALVAIEGYKQQIIAINKSIKDLSGSGSGFSLNDLWKSAAQQLADFGSNISFAPTTLGGNVQSVASNILDQKPADKLTGVIASKADQQIKETETTNDYLRDIRELLRVPGVQGGTKWRDPNKETPGTAADAAKFAVAGVGGM